MIVCLRRHLVGDGGRCENIPISSDDTCADVISRTLSALALSVSTNKVQTDPSVKVHVQENAEALYILMFSHV